MNIVIVHSGTIPAIKYGGTERVIWYLGKALTGIGHNVTFLVNEGSYCDFAPVIFLEKEKNINDQIPEFTDVIHFNSEPKETIKKPYIITIHGNRNDHRAFDENAVFVSRNHASRYGSDSFVYNGLDWDDYGNPDLNNDRNYFHFLGNAAWKVKNVKGAIDVILKTESETLRVLGGYRMNLKMGFRFTLSRRILFSGMVGGVEKNNLLQSSKGLIFPVRWHEPFGLAIVESLYFGCPVFGTPYGSLPELVNEDIGFLSNGKEELSEAIMNVYSRKKCHEYVRDLFNAKNMAWSYLEKYESVLNGEKLNNEAPKLVRKKPEKLLKWD